MGLPESIPYIYDNILQQNGVTFGSTLQYILSSGGKITSDPYHGISILNQCCYVKPGEYAPMFKQCYFETKTDPHVTLNAICKPYITNMGYFLASNGGDSVQNDNSSGYINNARMRVARTGQIVTYHRPYAQLFPNVRVAVGDFDLQQFVFVPTIRAFQHQESNPAAYITVPYKTYKEQYSVSHPDIIEIQYTIYYKANLNNTNQAIQTSWKLWGTQQTNTNLNYAITPNSSVQTFQTTYTSTRLRPINLLYYAPPLQYKKINVPFSNPPIVLPSVLTSGNGLCSTHGPDIQKLAFDNDDPTQVTHCYAYIDFVTAKNIIDSVGLWWAESLADTADMHGALTTSDAVHMPIIDSNGTPTGSITGGGVTDIEDSPIFQQWDEQNEKFPVGGSDAIGAVEIKPDQPPQPDTGETQTPIKLDEEDEDVMPQTPQLNGLGVFSNYYAMRKQGIDILNDFLWNSDETVIDDILNSLKLFGQSPIDAIVSLRLYPFDFTTLIPSSLTPENIILGRVDTGVSGYRIPSDCSTVLNLGSIYLPRKYGNFLDYSPYSSYSLYIPFCGVVNLNPNIFLDHYVSVRMVVDVTTGKCTAIIYVGSADDYGVPVQYVDGMIGVEIPVTAENMGKLGAAVLEAVGNTAIAAISTGVAGAAFAAVGGAIDVAFSDIAPQKTGSISASGSLSMPIKLYVAVSSPQPVIPYEYGHSKGYACDVTTTLAAQYGYTVCYNVDTSSIAGATDAERSEIKSLLEGGIFI